MVQQTVRILQKFTKPLRAIEYIVAIGVLWATVVSLFFIAQRDGNGGAQESKTFGYLIDRYEIITVVLSLMAVFSILDIIGLLQSHKSKSAIKLRSAATFGMTIGFFFVASLSVFSLGLGNLLWVNEFTLFLVTAILYLNLKVNKENADR